MSLISSDEYRWGGIRLNPLITWTTVGYLPEGSRCGCVRLVAFRIVAEARPVPSLPWPLSAEAWFLFWGCSQSTSCYFLSTYIWMLKLIYSYLFVSLNPQNLLIALIPINFSLITCKNMKLPTPSKANWECRPYVPWSIILQKRHPLNTHITTESKIALFMCMIKTYVWRHTWSLPHLPLSVSLTSSLALQCGTLYGQPLCWIAVPVLDQKRLWVSDK